MASNTGIKGGVYIRLGKEIDPQLLNLACRHHISEIALEVFSVHGVSKSHIWKMEWLGSKDFWSCVNHFVLQLRILGRYDCALER